MIGQRQGQGLNEGCFTQEFFAHKINITEFSILAYKQRVSEFKDVFILGGGWADQKNSTSPLIVSIFHIVIIFKRIITSLRDPIVFLCPQCNPTGVGFTTNIQKLSRMVSFFAACQD